MIQLFGQNNLATRFIANILQFKALEFAMLPPKPKAEIAIQDKDVFLARPVIVMRYLVERYPFPELGLDTPEKQAIMESACLDILEGSFTQDMAARHLAKRKPFILGSEPSLLDLVIEPIAENRKFSTELFNHAHELHRNNLRPEAATIPGTALSWPGRGPSQLSPHAGRRHGRL